MSTLERDYYDPYNRQHVHEMVVYLCNTPEKKVAFLNTLRQSLMGELNRAVSDYDLITARTKTMAEVLEKVLLANFGAQPKS